jgi:hypothetical protein
MTSYDTNIMMVRKWSNKQDFDVRAATELLIEHGHWLRTHQFIEKCTRIDGYSGARWIDFFEVEAQLEQRALIGSSGELVLLKAAVMLARDTLGASSLDAVNRGLVVRAIAAAWGVTR